MKLVTDRCCGLAADGPYLPGNRSGRLKRFIDEHCLESSMLPRRISLLNPFVSILFPAVFFLLSPGAGRCAVDYVYLLPLSHLDIGFTAAPREVAESYKVIIDEALEYTETDPDFKYTIETLWQLEHWLRRSTRSEIDRLRTAITAGRIGLTASYHTPHTADWSTEETNRFLYAAKYITEYLGLPFPRSAVLDDVPGFSWALPGRLSECGVDRLMTGTNTSLGGAIDIPVKDTAFLWAGADSAAVLNWLSRHSYAEGYFHYGFLTWKTLTDSLPERVAEFEEAGYPYDAIAVMYGFDNAHTGLGGVNLARRWNDTYGHPEIICGTVDDFFDHMESEYGRDFENYRGDWCGTWDGNSISVPKTLGYIRTAQRILPGAELFGTIADLLGLEGSHVDVTCISGQERILPGGAGFPGQERILPGGAGFPGQERILPGGADWGSRAGPVAEAWRNIVLFNEHSGGGGAWPGLLTEEQVEEQNSTWTTCALRALDLSRAAGDAAIRSIAGGLDVSDPFILVCNGGPVERSGPVRVEVPGAEDGIVEFAAIDVPAYGYRVYPVVALDDPSAVSERPELCRSAGCAYSADPLSPPAGASNLAGILSAAEPAPPLRGNLIESDCFRIEADPVTGVIVSILDKRYGRELVNPGGEFDFGALITATNRQTVFGLYNKVARTLSSIIVHHPAEDIHRMRIELLDTPLAWLELCLIDGVESIFLTECFDTDRVPYTPYEKHSRTYGLTFPFAGEEATLRYGGPAGVVSPGEDLLPGAFGANFCANDWVDLSINGGSYGITWTSVQNLVHEFGSMEWLGDYEPEAPNLTVRAFRHIDEVMFKGGGIGSVDPEPGLSPLIVQQQVFSPYDGDFDAARAASCGLAASMPLAGVYIEAEGAGILPATEASLLTLESSPEGGVYIAACKLPFDGDGIIIRIKESAGIERRVELFSDFFGLSNPRRVDPVERPLSGADDGGGSGSLYASVSHSGMLNPPEGRIILDVEPFEFISIRCDISPPGSDEH